MSTSPQPRPRVCLLVFGQSVNGAPWALGTLPHKALGGGLRMPRLSRHRGLEKGRKQPHRGLLTANPRAQIKPPNAPGSPSLRRSGAPRASRPASVVPGPPASRAVQQKDGTRAAPSWPSGGPQEPPDNRARGAASPGPQAQPQGRYRPAVSAAPAQAAHSPRHGRARAPPPSPRPRCLHRCAGEGGGGGGGRRGARAGHHD